MGYGCPHVNEWIFKTMRLNLKTIDIFLLWIYRIPLLPLVLSFRRLFISFSGTDSFKLNVIVTVGELYWKTRRGLSSHQIDGVASNGRLAARTMFPGVTSDARQPTNGRQLNLCYWTNSTPLRAMPSTAPSSLGQAVSSNHRGITHLSRVCERISNSSYVSEDETT